MLQRLAGLETEYAIRFSPEAGCARPSNELIFEAVAAAVSARVPTRPGRRRLLHKQLFTANGGSLYYEAVPANIAGGVIEGGTPECRGPSQLMLYQRAQDALLTESLPAAGRWLAARGHRGTLGLLKNCRDADGQIYGAQENYEAVLASGLQLGLYRTGLSLLLPLLACSALATWALVIALLGLCLALVPVGIAVALAASLIAVAVPAVGHLTARAADALTSEGVEGALMRVFQGVEIVVWWPVLTPYVWLVRGLAFREIRDGAEAFLLSRAVITGAGTLDDGALRLCEKGVALTDTARRTPGPTARALFDAGNLLKALVRPAFGGFDGLVDLFHRRQRLQLGLSDSNCLQFAEFLKLGTTMLVCDMAEAGMLADAPRLRRPVRAHHTLNADPTLAATVPTGAHGQMSALALQRWYLDRAERFVAAAPAVSIEARATVAAWRDALDALDDDPDRLVGRLDWVTKRFLIARAGGEPDADKKIDLRYHELGDGYAAQLAPAVAAPHLVEADEIAQAIVTPPQGSPAWTRGQLIRKLAASNTPATVSWGAVRVRGSFPGGGRVIRLSDYRDRAPREP